MTKPVVTVAALQLAEAGKLDLDAPVAAYLPEFGQLQVLTGFDGQTPQFRPPATAATVRQLITHTAGLAYDFFNPAQRRWQAVTDTESILSGGRAILASPLHTDPGTRWEYSIGTDWLGIAPLELPTTIVSLDPRLSGDFILPPGWGWGHGLALNKVDLPGMRRAFSGSWGGIFNTGFWVDRTSGVTAAIYSQCLPGSRPEFRNLAVGFELAC